MPVDFERFKDVSNRNSSVTFGATMYVCNFFVVLRTARRRLVEVASRGINCRIYYGHLETVSLSNI